MADPRVAMLDYDEWNKPASMMEIYSVARIIQRTVVAVSQERSSGGKGWHVTVRFLEPMLPAEIIALQFALGSDNRRETMNLGRVMASNFNEEETRWNLLYSQKLRPSKRPEKKRRVNAERGGHKQAKNRKPIR